MMGSGSLLAVSLAMIAASACGASDASGGASTTVAVVGDAVTPEGGDGGGGEMVEALVIVNDGSDEHLSIVLSDSSGLDWLDVHRDTATGTLVFTAGDIDGDVTVVVSDGVAWLRDHTSAQAWAVPIDNPDAAFAVEASLTRSSSDAPDSGAPESGEYIIDRPIFVSATVTVPVEFVSNDSSFDPYSDLIGLGIFVEKCQVADAGGARWSSTTTCAADDTSIQVLFQGEIPRGADREHQVGVFASRERCQAWNDWLAMLSTTNNAGGFGIGTGLSALGADVRITAAFGALFAVISEVSNRASAPCAELNVADELIEEWTSNFSNVGVDLAATGVGFDGEFSTAESTVFPFQGSASPMVIEVTSGERGGWVLVPDELPTETGSGTWLSADANASGGSATHQGASFGSEGEFNTTWTWSVPERIAPDEVTRIVAQVQTTDANFTAGGIPNMSVQLLAFGEGLISVQPSGETPIQGLSGSCTAELGGCEWSSGDGEAQFDVTASSGSPGATATLTWSLQQAGPDGQHTYVYRWDDPEG